MSRRQSACFLEHTAGRSAGRTRASFCWRVTLLCGGEGQLQVLPALPGVQRAVVELQREEGVDQGAESHPITPAGREVLDVDVLAGTCRNVSDSQGQKPSPAILASEDTNDQSCSAGLQVRIPGAAGAPQRLEDPPGSRWSWSGTSPAGSA